MATLSKSQLTTDINANATLTAAEKIILINMVDSYEDYFPQINTAARNALTPTLNQIIFNTDVNRNEYWNGSAWLGIGQDISTPLVVKIDLSSADILALNTTDIVVEVAPGPGLALIPSHIAYRFTYGSVQYASGGGTQNVNLLSSTKTVGTANVFAVISDAVIKAAGNRSGSVVVNSGTSSDAIVENDSLVLRANQAFTTGDGTLSVWITYSLIAY